MRIISTVAIYRRVSTKNQVEGASLDDQEAECRAYAERLGWAVVRVYTDSGHSAFTDNLKKRPAFQEMTQDAARGLFDAIIVFDLSRFARRQKVQFTVADDLQSRYKVRVISATEQFDTDTTEGWVTYSIYALSAELRSRQLQKHMTMTRASEVKRGRHIGAIPVGYTRTKGKLTPSDRADLVRRAFTLASNPDSSSSIIARQLNNEGWTMPDGDAVTGENVLIIIRNPVYIGKVRRRGVVYDGLHEPLVDQATWDRAQTTLPIRSSRKGGTLYSRTDQPEGILAGRVYCANCGSKMDFSWMRAKSIPYFVCRAKRYGRNNCNAQMGIVRSINADVIATLATLLTSTDWIDEAMNAAEQLLATPVPSLEPMVDPAKIQERIRRLVTVYQDGLKSDADYREELANLRAQLNKTAPAARPRQRVQLEDVRRQLEHLPHLLRAANPDEQRALLIEVVDQVFVNGRDVLAIRPTALYGLFLPAAVANVCYLTNRCSSTRDSANNTPLPIILPARAEVLL